MPSALRKHGKRYTEVLLKGEGGRRHGQGRIQSWFQAHVFGLQIPRSSLAPQEYPERGRDKTGISCTRLWRWPRQLHNAPCRTGRRIRESLCPRYAPAGNSTGQSNRIKKETGECGNHSL